MVYPHLGDLSWENEAGDGGTCGVVNQLPLHFHVGRRVDGADGERVAVGVRLSSGKLTTDALTRALQSEFTAGRSSVGSQERKVDPIQVTMCSGLDIVDVSGCKYISKK